MSDDPQPTQKTQPKGKGKPVEIPVPTREAVIRDLMKVAPPPPTPHKPPEPDNSTPN
jgi:hypothetical protein